MEIYNKGIIKISLEGKKMGGSRDVSLVNEVKFWDMSSLDLERKFLK